MDFCIHQGKVEQTQLFTFCKSPRMLMSLTQEVYSKTRGYDTSHLCRRAKTGDRGLKRDRIIKKKWGQPHPERPAHGRNQKVKPF